jgi:serine/threonine protein kinase
MSPLPSTVQESLSLPQLLQIDGVCQRFETAWQATSGSAAPPRIEDYLAGSDDAIGPALLRELVSVDIDHRRRRGESPSADEYHSRLPSLSRHWLEEELSQPLAPRPERYRLVDEIDKGAMGVVSRAHDATLDRDVAYKILQEKHRGRPELERRFVDEARIGGRLQHPSIVPIYDMGRAEDGRPFFTMKVVEGSTLDQLLTERASPADGLARFLTVFEHICQAVGYAHSQGIIHRDLKPRNVMVGAFGEVQVMDWGFAKVLKRLLPKPAQGTATTNGAELTELPISSTADSRGVTGGVGTPPYMPPEQARGESQNADERSDAFGLGAILCVILSGQPPFVGNDVAQTQAKAEAGDVADAFARLDGCGADPELIALCKACLAPRAEERPPNGGDVAARVAAYQAAVQERLRKAELERTAAEATATEARATVAAERKARRRTQALALAVVLLMAGGGGGGWFLQYERQAREAAAARRRHEADGAAMLAMSEARLLLDQAKANPLGDAGRFREALVAASKAKEVARTGEASENVRQQAAKLVEEIDREVGAAKRDRRLLLALMEVRRPREGPVFRSDNKGSMAKLAAPSADEQFQAAFREWDPTFDVDTLSIQEVVARLTGRPPAVVIEIVAALDSWASERRRLRMPPEKRQRLVNLANALDDAPESKSRTLREILARGTLSRERALGALSMVSASASR